MKKFIFIFAILISTLSLESCFGDKKNDPVPATVAVVPQKADTLEGLYSYIGIGNVFFKYDSISYKQSNSTCNCGLDTNVTASSYKIIWDNTGSFYIISYDKTNNVYYYQYNEFVSVNGKVFTFKEYTSANDQTSAYKNGSFNTVTYTKY